jgi:TM2 domain-containing membrane protein YozV
VRKAESTNGVASMSVDAPKPSFWRDETPTGRVRRVAAGCGIGAVFFGAQAVLQFFAGSGVAAVALAVSAGSMAIAAVTLLASMPKLTDVPSRRTISVDPSRYLLDDHGSPVTVDSLRHTRRRHHLVGTAMVVVALAVVAASTVASGASGVVYALVMAGVSILLLFPAIGYLAVDRLRINRAIDVLISPIGQQPASSSGAVPESE